MRLGVCTGPENSGRASRAGFDYIECALNAIAALEDTDFDELLQKAPFLPAPILKCNCFLPSWLKVTGPEADELRQREYLELALSRAAALGVETVVFGSGAARFCPEGWPMDQAWRQLYGFILLAGEYGQKHGVKIVLEPLRTQECNLLNLVAEACVISALADHPYVGVLGDSFHMACGGEGPDALGRAGQKLWHMHISRHFQDLSGRGYPYPGDGEEYQALMDVLKAMDYQGDISLEAGTEDFDRDAPLAVERIRPYL
ncbi:MAG: sugar phosphate isomerase/epimerase [Clostridiales bacterium]|nr:sugar phosphate isomerase/epimerase [Clostridiales bacterium]